MSRRQSETDCFQVVDSNRATLHVESADLGKSLSSLATTTTSLDHILQKCGDLGRFQFKHFFFMNFIAMNAGIISFYYVFGAAEPNHRCKLPLDVWSDDREYHPVSEIHEKYINSYIPKARDGNQWEKCVRFLTNDTNATRVNCPNGWVYDRSIFGYTFTEEADFVCANESKKTWLATVVQCGGFLVLIIGSLADRYGRKKILVIVTILLFSICLLSQIAMQWIPMTVKVKFMILLLNQLASGLALSNFSLSFILMLELTSVAYCSFVGNVAVASFTIGEVLVTVFAYITRDWQKLKWANLIFLALGVPYLYFMPESPLYMYAKERYGELEVLLRRMADQNGRKEVDWYSSYQTLVLSEPRKRTNSNPAPPKAHRHFLHRATLLKLCITSLIGFTVLMLYYQISYGLAVTSTSPYLAILTGAALEGFSYLTSSLLLSTRLGCKGSFTIMMSLTIICILLLPLLGKYSSLATIFVSQFGKYAISATSTISWIFVPGLFPTSIRNTANGLFVASGRVGAIVGPIINTTSSQDYSSYTFCGIVALAIVVLFASLMLPETKDKPMHDDHPTDI